jgi:cation diffusion facilitator CzcD-associated flavoprotein CzcO
MKLFSGLKVSVDGTPIDLAKTMSYKGMMFSGVPNFAAAFGYTNASWTLKADLTCEYVCRLLRYMDRHGYRQCMPKRDPSVAEVPWLDFTSGYVQRALGQLPRQGAKKPWKLYQNYARDLMALRFGSLRDGAMQFSK